MYVSLRGVTLIPAAATIRWAVNISSSISDDVKHGTSEWWCAVADAIITVTGRGQFFSVADAMNCDGDQWTITQRCYREATSDCNSPTPALLQNHLNFKVRASTDDFYRHIVVGRQHAVFWIRRCTEHRTAATAKNWLALAARLFRAYSPLISEAAYGTP